MSSTAEKISKVKAEKTIEFGKTEVLGDLEKSHFSRLTSIRLREE